MVSSEARIVDEIRDKPSLTLGLVRSDPVTLVHWMVLGNQACSHSLPKLESVRILRSEHGDEGVALLASGLSRGCLPALRDLCLNHASIGPSGAASLAAALSSRALPSLEVINLAGNRLTDEGLAALAPPLRQQLPKLRSLFLNDNGLSDAGVAALLAEQQQPPSPPPPRAGASGALQALEGLSLSANSVTDEQCAALAAALRGGALPRLCHVWLADTQVSEEARDAIDAVLIARREVHQDALAEQARVALSAQVRAAPPQGQMKHKQARVA